MDIRNTAAAALLILAASAARAEGDTPVAVEDFSKLPANTWTLIHVEDDSGGKAFARAIYAASVDRLYLWGTGGKMPARNVYLRYELESLCPSEPQWLPAFPESVRGRWTAEKFPPFRIYGQSGPDGLKHDEGPRLQCVGGYNSTNRVRWWDFSGEAGSQGRDQASSSASPLLRPSPIHTFNMACWDSRRNRILYYSDGFTFALDPATNSWTDLKPVNHPATCRTLAWASLCYDPGNDQALLFGGGLATNPSGGAPTWIYDCAANAWRRLELKLQPPLRCNAPIIYDPANKVMVLFGGYHQAAALNDTWIYDCRKGRWERRTPNPSPPPMFAPAAAAVPGGGILVCGFDARKVKLHHATSSSAIQETWIYDVAADKWSPAGGDLKLAGYSWLTAAGSPRHGVVFLVGFGPQRRTYAFRYDPSGAPAGEREGAAPGTVAWKYPEQKLSLEQAPPSDPGAHAKLLSSLPVNEFVDAKPPGMLISKTWSSATIDTYNSEVFYVGGGHCGYSGNDFARYSIAENRWSLDFPPRFPPFLEGTNAGIFGWSYGMMPFSQHTYLWYAYDPLSRTVLYLARPSLFDGVEIQLGEDAAEAFVYESAKHGYADWVYDPAARKMRRPSFGRPFANPWHLALAGTPKGVYAACSDKLYHAKVDGRSGRVEWALVDPSFPKPREKISYHYEFQPLLYDSWRDRLIQLKGDATRVDVFARPLGEQAAWTQLATEGSAAIGREAVYVPKHDAVLWLTDKQLFALDCATRRMTELKVALPEGLYGHECALLYDPGHDVCVALIPGSFNGPMQTFLFRFDPKAARHERRD